MLRLDFTIRTDHKPLISLLGSRAFGDLPPRILRFRLRLLRFRYNIVQVPGKNLITADTLSRAPLQTKLTTEEKLMETEYQVYVDQIMQHVPAIKTKIEQIREAQNSDSTCKQLGRYTEKG